MWHRTFSQEKIRPGNINGGCSSLAHFALSQMPIWVPGVATYCWKVIQYVWDLGTLMRGIPYLQFSIYMSFLFPPLLGMKLLIGGALYETIQLWGVFTKS